MDDAFFQLLKLTEPKKDTPGAQSQDGTAITGGTTVNSNGCESNLFTDDDLIIPTIVPVKNSSAERPTVLVIDDDYPTLDIMKIFLQRDYEYVSFDNPKDAIFWLNTHIPDLIFIDCYLTLIKSKRVIEIIRANAEVAKVPIFYVCEPDEVGPISAKLPEGVLGVLTRPVCRGHLQDILDYIFTINKGVVLT